MQKLRIEPTSISPLIYFNDDKSTLYIQGRSVPENALECYRPAINWIKHYVSDSDVENMFLDIELDYFNTTTSRCFVLLFKILEDLQERTNFKIYWRYEASDEDMQVSILEYQRFTKIPIEPLEFENEDEEDDILDMLYKSQ